MQSAADAPQGHGVADALGGMHIDRDLGDFPRGHAIGPLHLEDALTEKRHVGSGAVELVARTARRQYAMPWPRFGTSTIRSKLMNSVPSAFTPTVRTVTIPWVEREADSRFASTSDAA